VFFGRLRLLLLSHRSLARAVHRRITLTCRSSSRRSQRCLDATELMDESMCR
jgi:hypothetical protein